jgi:hypothetical protein
LIPKCSSDVKSKGKRYLKKWGKHYIVALYESLEASKGFRWRNPMKANREFIY